MQFVSLNDCLKEAAKTYMFSNNVFNKIIYFFLKMLNLES